MPFKPKLLPCLIAMMAAGCGGGGNSDNPPGQTATTAGVLSANSLVACVDVNQNWQCDDGDTVKTVQATGATGLSPTASQYTLIESRDAANLRRQLLVSQRGSAEVTGLSTLRTMLAAAGKTSTDISALEATLSAAHGAGLASTLEVGLGNAVQANEQAFAALTAYSLATYQQASATPTAAAITANTTAPTIGTHSLDASWDSTEASGTLRQLSVQGSTVLNNSESNRLYLFDASAATVSSNEIDLIPPVVSVATATYPKALRLALAAMDRVASVFVDTASAASSISGTPQLGSPVVLEPGKGIVSLQVVDGGKSAFVLLNMLSGHYKDSSCLDTRHGNEGLFKVSLTSSASYRMLAQSPACIHSGFSLLASDAAGSRAVAWDATGRRLWVLDGATLAQTSAIDIQFDADKSPQALAMSPGGRFVAVAGYGRVTLVDLNTGKRVAELTGDWLNVSQLSFAGGTRKLLIASANQVHTLTLDNALQLVSTSSAALSAQGDDLKGLAVSPDGDSYVASSDKTVYWSSVATSTSLVQAALPNGLAVQHIALAGDKLVVLSRGLQDQQYKLYRVPFGLAKTPTVN